MKEGLTDNERAELRRLIVDLGPRHAAKVLNMAEPTVLRAESGHPVRRGTVAYIRNGLVLLRQGA